MFTQREHSHETTSYFGEFNFSHMYWAVGKWILKPFNSFELDFLWFFKRLECFHHPVNWPVSNFLVRRERKEILHWHSKSRCPQESCGDIQKKSHSNKQRNTYLGSSHSPITAVGLSQHSPAWKSSQLPQRLPKNLLATSSCGSWLTARMLSSK